jgi:hypothetical protein
MADVVKVGSAPNDGSGDPLREGFIKINLRFSQIAALLNNRGAWQAGAVYAARDWVVSGGQAYIATAGHTASGSFATDLAAGRWIAADVTQLIHDLSEAGEEVGGELVAFLARGTGAVPRRSQERERGRVVYGDHGTLAQSLAVAGTQRPVDLSGETLLLDAVPANTYGTRFEHGKVCVPSRVAGFRTQLQSYAHRVNGLMVGRENLAAFWKACTAGTLMTAVIVGDSTVENNLAYARRSHDLVQRAFYAAGINGVKTVNRGVSGSSWSDLDVAQVAVDIAAGMRLLIIKYDINDAAKANPLATRQADARAKLAAIRALPGGDVGSLSIVLMGPNSTYSPSTGQDYRWFEDLRPCNEQLVLEFEVAYFDTYAYLQNTRPAFAIWQDDILPLHESIHPDAVAVYWIWMEGFKTHVLGGGHWNIAQSNHLFNIDNYTRPALPGVTPNGYDFGVTVEAALVENGWPAAGHLMTVRHADGVAVQTLSTLDVVPRTFMRRGGGTAWTQWSGIAVPMTSFLNSWAIKGGGYMAPFYQVGADGIVETGGVVTGGVLGTSCIELATNLRPAYTQPINPSVTVWSNGNIIITAASNTTVSLAGRFKVLP